MIPFWDDPSNPWDSVQLGETVLPGVCSVDCAVKRDIEVKKSKGSDGATIKDNGYEPADVKIKWRIHTKEQWEAAQELLPKIHPRVKGGDRKPLAIINPSTTFLGIETIYISEISSPKVNSDKELEVDISAIEWIEQPKPPKSGGYAGSGKGNYDDTVDEEQNKLIEQLLDEAERQAWLARQEEEGRDPWGEYEVPPFSGDDAEPLFVDNAEEGYDGDDEYLETT